ncbi:MAG: proline racemase family protein, partial [Chlorobi bacterium]|nr:proline racemase family protein [Chlorobiota bacterium]
LGLDMDKRHAAQLADIGMKIKKAITDNFNIRHPLEPDLGFLYGTVITGAPYDFRHHSRNVCIFADGQIDRSATGTGISARAAIHVLRGELHVGDTITIESILGTTMDVSVAEITRFDEYQAVIPEIRGSAFYTGTHEFWIDPSDPLGNGFILS